MPTAPNAHMKNWQKSKLVLLVELLRRESSPEKPLLTPEICAYMESLGIPCDRRVVARDIQALNEIGIVVHEVRIGKFKGYYMVGDNVPKKKKSRSPRDEASFTTAELKLLIDAVQAASFVTEEKTEELIDKIALLGGGRRAELLKKNKVLFNTRKHSNENVYSNIDALETALLKKKKVVFCYYDLDMNHEKVYRREGHHYVVEPIALVFNEDNYYLSTYSPKHDSTANYRIDRMEDVEILEDKICEKASELRASMSTYTGQVFKMYGGKPRTITIQFDPSLVGAVYDRFGEDTVMKQRKDGQVTARVKVQLSPPFWGWLFQFGKLMKITVPKEVAEEYKEKVRDVLEQEP
ncbi:MAG: WYL domain-containing protein [Oscillospiraceae bacterium]|nr:WYL domain-containing protein [Oscillospiraceae bacterium]